MKLSDLQEEIEKDSHIDQHNLDRESLKIPMIHAKYYRYFVEELRTYKGMESAFKALKKDRMHYYLGKAPDDVYKEEPLDFKVLKVDLDPYLDADPKYSAARNQLELQKIKVDMLESFIKMLTNRSFIIKDAIAFKQFQAGN